MKHNGQYSVYLGKECWKLNNTIGILLIGIFVISGCASSALHLNLTEQVGATSMSQAVKL